MVSNLGSGSGGSSERRLLEADEQAMPTSEGLIFEIDTSKPSIGSRVSSWARLHPILIAFWVFTLAVGFPLLAAGKTDVVLDTCILFSFWLTALAVKLASRTAKPSHHGCGSFWLVFSTLSSGPPWP